MLRIPEKQLMTILLVMAALVIVAPTIMAFQQTNPPPQVGTVPVYDGGRRSQLQGYQFSSEGWRAGESSYESSQRARLLSPDRFFETGSE